MFSIRKKIASFFFPELRDIEKRSRKVKMYEDFFPKLLDPQIIDQQMIRDIHADGEIKDICVLFIDVRGFTSFSEKVSLRLANNFLNSFYDIVIHHTRAQKGIIDKFIGDGAMSVFGVYKQGNHNVEHAAAAARGILKDFTQMTAQSHEPDLSLGLGLNKGPALVGMFGNGEYLSFTAVGHTVNLAARIESTAVDNNILVSNSVAKYLSPDSYRLKGKFALKGVKSKVELFELI